MNKKLENFKIYHIHSQYPKVNLAILASIIIGTIIFCSIFVSQLFGNINNFSTPFEFLDVPANHTPHKRVFIIGIDGIGSLPSVMKTPGIYQVINNGIYTFQAMTVYPSFSAESWTSLLHGVSPNIHQIYTDNPPKKHYSINSKYPSIFRILHEQNSQSVMAVFSNWYFIPDYIVEDGIGVRKFCLYTEKSIIKYFDRFMKTNDPTLVFFQLDETDEIGHRYGYFTDEQSKQLVKTDKTVQKIINIIEKYDPNNESLILILTDHGGGGLNPQMHGSADPHDMTIFWTARGKGICKNKEIKQQISIIDTAKFVASYLDLKIPETWEGENFFSNYQCK